MTMHDKPRIARRSYLRGAGVTLATLGGMTGSAVANKGGRTPLTDKAADILVYWSEVGAGDSGSDDPDMPSDFGYLEGPNPAPPGGLFLPTHDPGNGGMFDFSTIEMTPNGKTLHNRWQLFGGAVLASKPKPYILLHEGNGVYKSRGQVMNFKAMSAGQIEALLPFPELPPPLAMLAGEKWHAVGSEVAQLDLDVQGEPDPTNPKWGATRVDFYERKSGDYSLSLLYLIDADTTPAPGDNLSTGVLGAGQQLITGGRLDPGGQ